MGLAWVAVAWSLSAAVIVQAAGLTTGQLSTIVVPAGQGPGMPPRRLLVGSLAQLRNALDTAEPGDLIEVANGVYTLSGNLTIGRSGKKARPITVRAQNRGQAKITGYGEVLFNRVTWVVWEGFKFTHDATQRGWPWGCVTLQDCNNVRFTRNYLDLHEDLTDLTRVHQWVCITGKTSHDNRIDHNLFHDKTLRGDYVVVTGDGRTGAAISQRDRIDHNHFLDFKYGNGQNGLETVRVAANPSGNLLANLTIEDNLFERCSGEDEIISLKCGAVTVLHNTFIDCNGSMVFRNGNRGLARGNIFINTYEDDRLPFPQYRAGGIRFYGSDHKIVENYFYNLNGTGVDAPLNLMHGAPAGSGNLGGADGLPSTRCEVARNVWVSCAELRIGYESDPRPLPPADCTFSNNLIYGNHRQRTLLNFYQADGVRYSDNLLWPGDRTGLESAGRVFSENEFKVLSSDPGRPYTPDRLKPDDAGPESDLVSGTRTD